jgi:CDP-6-deoxy-D-xylo-4-hexulose-3-dehydrase
MLDPKDINEILKLVDLKFNHKNFTDTFLPGTSNVPVSGKVIDKEDVKKMIEACLDGWLTTGRFNKIFEKNIVEFTGSKLAITVNSGSSANLLAFMTLTSEKLKERAIKVGDEIITVAAGFPTTVNPILQFGAIPVFIDIEIPTYNIDISKIEKAITKKTKAIMIAHTMGNPFDVKSIREICDKYNLWLIQDTCDALGAKFDNKKLGYYGDIGTVSFYPAHHITMGEGGLVYTNSLKLKMIAESFRDWGRDCYCEPGKDNTCNKRFEWKLGDLPFGYDHKYTYSHLGYNLKITDMQAACGVSQLSKLNGFINQRIINHAYLYDKFKKFEDYFILPEKTKNSEPSWFGFLLTIKNKKIIRNDLIKFLNMNKIGTRLLFAGNITKQPYMKNLKYRIEGSLENTDKVMTESFWIGVYPGLNREHLDYTYSIVENYINKLR